MKVYENGCQYFFEQGPYRSDIESMVWTIPRGNAKRNTSDGKQYILENWR